MGVAADATKPTLTTASVLPAKETTPTYTLGTSDSVKLVFSEAVQAGTGAVSFKASYTSPTVVAPTASELFFSGTTAAASPSPLLQSSSSRRLEPSIGIATASSTVSVME